MQGQIEHFMIPGPAGALETEISIPEPSSRHLFVMCHPHPLQQGSMDNKVVTSMIRAFNELNFISVRFNYRGVGKSEGTYAQGLGETEDALTVIQSLKSRFSIDKFVLGGFSFGGYVAYQAALEAQPQALILLSPAVVKFDLSHAAEPSCPLLIIQGANDDVISAANVYDWLKTRHHNFTLHQLADTSHFFHGKLLELRRLSQMFIKDQFS